jgi:hypothetical protein
MSVWNIYDIYTQTHSVTPHRVSDGGGGGRGAHFYPYTVLSVRISQKYLLLHYIKILAQIMLKNNFSLKLIQVRKNDKVVLHL